jgi:transposase
MNKIDARKLSPDALKALRIQALRMRETLHLPWRQIAQVMGVHVTTVLAWAQRYASEGEAGLQSKKPGRAYMSGRTLREEQEWLLRTVLTSEAPSVRGLNFALWNRRAVVQLVQQLFGIEMPIRTVGEYLRRWGYTPQRPSRRALEQKPLDVERWLKEIYPVIARRAKQESAIIYWMDETAVAQDGHWVRGYAPVGHTPVLNVISQRFGLTMVSAVSNQGRVCFEFLEGAANKHSTLDFMQKLVADNAGQKVFLIMDNLKVHHAKDVTAWAQAHTREIELFYLPPYTPQLNPDEHLNRDFKTALRSVSGCSTRTGLLAQAQEFMQSLVNLPERVKSYFRHGEVVFAA